MDVCRHLTQRVAPGSRLLRNAGFFAVVGLIACADRTGGTDLPGVQIRPVDPITFVFHNPTATALHVDWTQPDSALRVLRDGAEMLLGPGCSPACGEPCACAACPPHASKVYRLEPGEELRITWNATRYSKRGCGDAAGCECAEPWPATSGSYRVLATAYRGVSGGIPSPTDPGVLEGAQLDPASGSCTASTLFELVGGAEITVPFSCS